VTREAPIKVAIIGGGVAGVTAAFELTRPEHAGKYSVTIYQTGWRLGGKGASGRGVNDRIEEHGLHLWMGFYENAFRVMRECYAELGRDRDTCPISDWRDAFVPDHHAGMADRSPSGPWLTWKVHMPAFAGMPGDADPLPRFTVADYLARAVTLVRTLIQAVQTRAGEGARAAGVRTGGGPGTPESYLEGMARFLKLGQLASLTAIVEALNLMEIVIGSPPRHSGNVLLRFHDAVAAAIREQLEGVVRGDDESRRLWEIVDLVLAVVRGSIRFGLMTNPRGFEAIDDYDCREWLLVNGASQRAVDSAFVRALYDLAFAYENGDSSRPRIAAGQALRGALRVFFTYRGAFFWKMQAGMGDIVFAPFYEVLQRRGVRFEFFHRVETLRLGPARSGERPFVEAIDVDVQARVTAGAYRPLVDVHGLPCWPSEPDWSQLEDGERLRRDGVCFESHWDPRKAAARTLRVGEDFDLVVVAVGVGAVPLVCRELVERDPKWRAMAEHVKSVPTQAFQIWLRADVKQLGWTDDPINVSGFVYPFDTWADMTHLVARERWPKPPRSIAYFCSVLPDAPAEAQAAPDYGATRRAEVRRSVVRFLDRDIKHLWPASTGPTGRFRWDLLVDPEDSEDSTPPDAGTADERQIDGQFWTANVNPTDRYALSLPGTLKHRISPLDNSIDNLTVAGDWTDCGFNEGCVEAAAMSGRLAAHALTGLPRLADIPGFDHP